MAKRIETLLIDDVDGTTSDDVQTIEFGFAGELREIDLAHDNRLAFLDAVQPYLTASRRIGPLRGAPTPRRSRSTTAAPPPDADVDRAAVREWAREQGETIGVRGRIPTRILDAYRAATSS